MMAMMMNEKIYKLAVEVGIIKEEEGYFWIQSVDPLEKFAEAIVKECISKAEDYGLGSDAVEQLKEHFGVEE